MNKQRIRLISVTVVAGVALLVIGASIIIGTGAYNVAATAEHTPFVRWLLNSAQERSVAVRARSVPAPPPLDSMMVRHGFEHYHAMCATCHGAPGIDRSEIGTGMTPKPPDLAEAAAEWTDRELFWIIRHGIKLAGMPAFGITHSDEELWGIVAFLRRLDEMGPEEYRHLATEAGTDHAHAAGPDLPGGTLPPSDEAMHDHARTTGTGRKDDAGGTVHGGMNQVHAADDQAHAPDAGLPSAAQAQAHHADRADDDAAPGRGDAADERGVHPAQVDAEATQKLKSLVAGLLRDDFVRERISADSALRRRWENDDVRKQLIGSPVH